MAVEVDRLIVTLEADFRKYQADMVRGPGSSRSDSIPAMLSNGEYVINATATAKHKHLLDAINSGAVARLASGGMVGTPTAVRAAGLGAPSVTVNATFNVANGTPEGVEKLKREVVPLMQQVAKTEIANQIDRNPAFSKLKRG